MRPWFTVIGIVLGGLLLRHPAGIVLGGALGYAIDRGWVRVPRTADPRIEDALEQAYATLGVDADASEPQIHAAYRRMIAQYHPDRVAGAAPEIQQLAETRAGEINAAYDRIRDARGWSR